MNMVYNKFQQHFQFEGTDIANGIYLFANQNNFKVFFIQYQNLNWHYLKQ